MDSLKKYTQKNRWSNVASNRDLLCFEPDLTTEILLFGVFPNVKYLRYFFRVLKAEKNKINRWKSRREEDNLKEAEDSQPAISRC